MFDGASDWHMTRLRRKVHAMTTQRKIRVRLEFRRVSIPGDDGSDETVSYPGVTLTRVCADCPDEETWLPMGELPTEVDDEALIVALREAFLWRNSTN